MQKGLVVALVLALAAVIAYFAFANGGKEAPPPDLQRPGVPQADGQAKAAQLASGDTGMQPAAVAANERQEVATGGAATAADASTCSIRGRIVDVAGKPRQGVEVELNAFALPEEFDVTMPQAPRDSANGSNKAHGVTGADGRFALATKVGNQGRIELAGSELVFSKGQTSFPRAKGDVELGDLEVLAGAAIAGTVRDARGQPVADVKVSAALDELAFGEVSSAVTDRDGHFRVGKLKPGTMTLRTASAQFLPTTAKVTLKAEEQKVDVVLEVAAGKAVSGQVVDDVGRPVAGIKVGAKRTEDRPGLQMQRFTPDEATETDAGGWFLLSGLSGDTASIRAFGDGYTMAAESNVPVGTGNLLLRVQRLAVIAGTLRDLAGKPIAGSSVIALAARGSGAAGIEDIELPFAEGRVRATTAQDGTFRVEGVTPGTVTLRAEGRNHRPAVQRGIQVAPAQTMSGVQLIADLGATAHVKVVDDAGKPVAGAMVRAAQKSDKPQAGGTTFRARRVAIDDDNGDVHMGGGPERLGEATTDAAGMAELTGLPGGMATLTATHAEFAEAQPLDLAVPAVGAVDAAMAMRRPSWASVSVTGADGPLAGAKFVVHGPIGQGEDERDRKGSVDASGQTRFGPLPSGDYFAELELEPKGRSMGGGSFVFGGDSHRLEQSRVRFTLAAGEDVPVQLQKPILAQVHGTVTGVDGPAAGVVVELARRGEAGEPDLPGLAGLGGPSARTDEQGQFALDEVEAGDYELVFGKVDQLVKAREPLLVPANTPEVQKDLALRFGKLKLAVFEQGTANGIGGAEVELVPVRPGTDGKAPPQRRVMMFSMTLNNGAAGPESTTMTMGQSRAKTGPDGSVEIDDVPPGTYTVRITDDAHSERELGSQQVVERQTTDCGKVELQAAGHIRGTVVTADGKPAGMSMVFCRRVGDEGTEPKREPAMGGQFKFDGLAPGRYALKAQPLMGDNQPFGPEVEVEVLAGRTPVNAPLTLAKE